VTYLQGLSEVVISTESASLSLAILNQVEGS